MNIKNITLQHNYFNKPKNDRVNANSYQNYGLRISNPLTLDTISFKALPPKLNPREKMGTYAIKFLE